MVGNRKPALFEKWEEKQSKLDMEEQKNKYRLMKKLRE